MKTRYAKSTGTFYPLDIDYPNLPTDVQEVDQADYEAAINRPAGATFDFDVNGVLMITPAPVPTAAEQTAAAWKSHQAQAQAALNASDMTVLRCVEKAVAVPTEWATYRASLRAIVGATTVGDPTQPLPTKPAYPAGT